ncbi:hypothetical protein [Ponticaulis sp.]|uniref:hypothetical protein n=1 Tax=Ponticaulis sp. TaxID=2020902 RepID=UPI0026369270|nr:hypothetical protein [Ponticaulis sp.]MDF1680446.1 hypothetical protein [Ponticaulis sp.]
MSGALRPSVRPTGFLVAFMVTLMLNFGACSQSVTDNMPEDPPAEFPYELTIDSTILEGRRHDQGIDVELYRLSVPGDAYRRLFRAFGEELSDGKYTSIVLYLALYLQDGELHLPHDVLDEWVDARIFVTLRGVDDEYTARIRRGEEVGVNEVLPTEPFEGEHIEDEYDVFQSDHQLGRRFLWNSEKYGEISLTCDRSALALARGELRAGSCSVHFLARPFLLLQINFPIQQIRNWETITDDALALLDEWDLREVE